MSDRRVVFLHGFSDEEITRIIRGVKSVVGDADSAAFCTSTATNLEWKVQDLIDDVLKEHDYMKKNAGRSPS